MFEQITTIAVAIVGVAILAVIVSKRSATVDVVNSAGAAFAGALSTAVSPVTGSSAGNGYSGYGYNGGFYNPQISVPGLYH